jgi:hypothetical protein
MQQVVVEGGVMVAAAAPLVLVWSVPLYDAA